MANSRNAVLAQGWMKVPQTPTEHNFEKGYPLCGWKLPIKKDANGRCCECERATQPAAQGMEQDAARYRWLRERDLETVHKGGVFAGMTPENYVLNGADLDAAIDAAIDAALAAQAKQGGA